MTEGADKAASDAQWAEVMAWMQAGGLELRCPLKGPAVFLRKKPGANQAAVVRSR